MSSVWILAFTITDDIAQSDVIRKLRNGCPPYYFPRKVKKAYINWAAVIFKYLCNH